jgi:SnoaL-like polyketide cyclase
LSDAATLAANRVIGRSVLLELWGQGKLELADELYAPNYIDHVGRGPEPAHVSGPEGIKHPVMQFRTAFPDLTIASRRNWPSAISS